MEQVTEHKEFEAPLHHKRILVTDGEESTRGPLTKTLREEGYHVAETLDYRSALDRVHQFQPDVVIADINTSVANLIEMMNKLKEHNSNLIIYLIGSRIGHGDAHAVFTAQADGYFIRPIHEEFIVDAILSALKDAFAEEMETKSSTEKTPS